MNPLAILTLLFALQASPVEGPISDLIGARVDRLAARVEAWKAESEQANQSRFAEMMQEIAAARNERRAILDSIADLREQRDGLFAGLAEFKREREGLLGKLAEVRDSQTGFVGRLENLHSRFDGIEKRWTPIQNLVDRLTSLVWKILWLCVSLIIVIVIVGSIGLFLYVRLKSKIVALSQGK